MWEYTGIPDLFNAEWPCVKSCLFPNSLAIPLGFYPPFSRHSARTEVHLATIPHLSKAAFPENFTSVIPKHLGGRGKFEHLAGKPHIIQDEQWAQEAAPYPEMDLLSPMASKHHHMHPNSLWELQLFQNPKYFENTGLNFFFFSNLNNTFFKTSFAKHSHLNIIWEQVSEVFEGKWVFYSLTPFSAFKY